jgi:hypothetical protein
MSHDIEAAYAALEVINHLFEKTRRLLFFAPF